MIMKNIDEEDEEIGYGGVQQNPYQLKAKQWEHIFEFNAKINNQNAGRYLERSGKFELIFPFNKASEDLAIALNRSQGSSMSGPNYMKMMIQEIKKWESQYLEYVAKQYSYY
eukprot:403368366